MGLRGPAPQPIELRLLRGSALPAQDCPTPARSIPDCPPVLKRESKRMWVRLCAELDAMGLLYGCDWAMLTALCEAWGELIETTKELDRTGKTITTPTGYVSMHPLVAIKNAAAERVVKISREFGLSPSARTRVQKPQEPKKDEFDSFVQKNGTHG
jgi:P27 family predicted phage terminase small subunit